MSDDPRPDPRDEDWWRERLSDYGLDDAPANREAIEARQARIDSDAHAAPRPPEDVIRERVAERIDPLEGSDL